MTEQHSQITPPPQPIPVSEGLPEPEGPTDIELLSMAGSAVGHEIAVGEYEPENEIAVEAYGSELCEFARAVLSRWGRPTPQPIPVSQRLPGPEDCDAEGMCWWWCSPAERWVRCGIPQPDPTSQVHTHWLPAHALPTPEVTND